MSRLESWMKRWLTVLTAVLMAGSALALVGASAEEKDDDGTPSADPTKGPGRSHKPTPSTASNETEEPAHEDDDEDDERDDDEDDEAKPHEARRPGRMVQQNGSVDGRYVDFGIDNATCSIVDFQLYGQPLFDRVTLMGGACEFDENLSHEKGSRFELESEDASLAIHDSPNGLIRFHADDANVSFDFAAGVTLNETEDGGLDVRAGNLSARLHITGSDDEDDDEDSGGAQVSLAGDVATVMDARGNFLAHPLSGSTAERREILDAMRHGKVGGEVDVIVEDGQVTSEVLAFDDVVIKVHKKSDSVYRFLIDANLTEGRAFVINLAPGALAHDKVGVRYYDVDASGVASETAISEADSAADALDLQPGEGPEYWVFKDKNGTHALIAVPHFSIHLVELQGLAGAIVPNILAGLVLGVGFVAVAAVGMMPRRKRD